MKRLRYFNCLLAAILLFSSCAESVVEKERKAISRGVYATKDSFDASRYDLAKSYNNELTRIVAPPLSKDRIKIPAFITDTRKTPKKKGEPQVIVQGTKYVVLPDNEQNTNVIVANSPQYKDLLEENTRLAASEALAQKDKKEYKEYTDEVIRAKDAELAKLRAKPNIFVRIWHFLTGFLKWGSLGFILLIIGLLIASIFIPALLPLIFNIFRIIGAVIGFIFRLFSRAISALANLFKKK